MPFFLPRGLLELDVLVPDRRNAFSEVGPCEKLSQTTALVLLLIELFGLWMRALAPCEAAEAYISLRLCFKCKAWCTCATLPPFPTELELTPVDFFRF